ncbi:MAG: VPLPA-CTERM sorting domain-containing protein [Pseudomonadota bacterium]
MKLTNLLAVAAAAAFLSAGSASAAVQTLDLTGAQVSGVGTAFGSFDNGTGLSGTIDLTPSVCGPFCTTTLTQTSDGLGFNRGADLTEGLDSAFFISESLTFNFATTVIFDSVSFTALGAFGGAFDDWDISVNGATVASASKDNPYIFNGETGESLTISAIYTGADFANGGEFFFFDNFRVKSIDATVVPLPAAGWLLLAGVGGLAALKRRKKA